MSDASEILVAAGQGAPYGAEQLLPLVYDELRRLAAAQLAREAPGHTLDATALVHEAYLRLGSARPLWASRRHFFAAAAEAMRRILVENARKKGRQKRGRGLARRDLDGADLAVTEPHDDLLALDEALDGLSAADPQAAEVVKLRYFAGLTLPEVARTLNTSPRTADRLWAYARAWLFERMADA
jgi:RNA polymerase sigma factor (TIGR02999 family)